MNYSGVENMQHDQHRAEMKHMPGTHDMPDISQHRAIRPMSTSNYSAFMNAGV